MSSELSSLVGEAGADLTSWMTIEGSGGRLVCCGSGGRCDVPAATMAAARDEDNDDDKGNDDDDSVTFR